MLTGEAPRRGDPGLEMAHRSLPALRTRLLRLGGAFLGASLLGVAFAAANLSVQAARSVTHPARSTPAVSPAEHGLPFEPVRFASGDGVRLAGWFIPGGPTAVVLAHGHGASKAGMLGHAEYLHRAGYSLLLFDFRASGESEGEASTLGYYEWQDLAGAATYLRTRPDLALEGPGLLGASMGAAAAIMLGDEARAYRAIVADSSFASGESLVRRFDRWFRLPSWPFSSLVPWAIERAVGVSPAELAPVRRVGDIAPTPLFIIHGALDSGVSADDARALHAAAGDPKQLWIVGDGTHAGSHGLVTDEYERRVLAFFEQHLGRPARSD